MVLNELSIPSFFIPPTKQKMESTQPRPQTQTKHDRDRSQPQNKVWSQPIPPSPTTKHKVTSPETNGENVSLARSGPVRATGAYPAAG